MTGKSKWSVKPGEGVKVDKLRITDSRIECTTVVVRLSIVSNNIALSIEELDREVESRRNDGWDRVGASFILCGFILQPMERYIPSTTLTNVKYGA